MESRAWDRGNLEDSNGGKAIEDGTLQFAEEWGLDPLDNWTSFEQDTDTGTSGWELDQTRDHNEDNEIKKSDNASTHVDHDAAGNMTKTPKPDNWSAHYDLTYDYWNRLVKVVDGSTTVAEYRYDGLNRRIRKYVPGTSDWDVSEYYYSHAWQALEVRTATGVTRSGDPLSQPPVSTDLDRQFVWGLRYIDDLILRDRDADADSQTGDLGKADSGLEERLYAMQDANFNVVAIADSTSAVKERYTYSAYGQPEFRDPDFTIDTGGTDYDWEYLYTGRRREDATGLYYFRARYYHAQLGRFLSRDPLEHDTGDPNLYQYVASAPITQADPSGLQTVAGPVIGYPVEKNDGLTQKERNQACAEALATIPPGIRNKVGAFITCFKGKKIICVNSRRHPLHNVKDEDLTPQRAAENVIHRCKVVHEKTHVPDSEKCSDENECKVLDMKDPKDMLEKRKSECRAIQAEVDCVRAAKKKVPSSFNDNQRKEYLARLDHRVKVLKLTAEKRAQCKELGMEIK